MLERPDNRGFEGQKRTKMAILCSGEQEIGIGKRKSDLPANHRARQCALEVPRRAIRVRGDLQELHPGQAIAKQGSGFITC